MDRAEVFLKEGVVGNMTGNDTKMPIGIPAIHQYGFGEFRKIGKKGCIFGYDLEGLGQGPGEGGG